MSYDIITITVFEKQAKRLVKKYPSLKGEVLLLIQTLREAPTTQGVPLGNNCYKIRIAIASKGRGKSGGARVITYVQVVQAKVFLLSIYDKAEQADVTDRELTALLKLVT